MDGISGASAVIALGGFVATTLQKLNKLIQNLRSAPKELRSLESLLIQLKHGLTGAASLIHRSNSKTERHDSIDLIDGAVKSCAGTLNSLEVLIDKTKGSHSPPQLVQKTWTSLKYVLSKDEIQELQTQLLRSTAHLNLAISIDSSHLTRDVLDVVTSLLPYLMAKQKPSMLIEPSQAAPTVLLEIDRKLSILIESSQTDPTLSQQIDKKPLLLAHPSQSMTSQNLDSGKVPLSLIGSNYSAPRWNRMENQKSPLLINSSQSVATQDKISGLLSRDAGQPSRIVSKDRILTWYNGILGNVTIQKKLKFVGSASNIRVADARSVSEETVIVLRPSFLKKHYELRFMESFGRISRTLNVDHVVNYKDPIFQMCRTGDILGLHGAFCGGRASPDIVNPDGMGLLHFAAINYQLATCIWLLDNGVDADRVNIDQEKALTQMGIRPSLYKDRATTQKVLDIARLLVRRQKDLSAFDVSLFFQDYQGPPEGAVLILSEYPAEYDRCSTDDDNRHIYPTLGAVLNAYARQPLLWEPILRALIRRGADIHAPVRRDPQAMKQIGYPCLMAKYGTPLDELFRNNRDRSAAQTAAEGWLQILGSEGYDPLVYLEEEMTVHTRDMQFTHASTSPIGYASPRQLSFELGDRPSVYWDWWIDPASSTSLLREEFKCLVTTSPDWLRISKPWKEYWPFTFPKWSKLHQRYVQEPRLSQCKVFLVNAEARAGRRIMKKAAKAAREKGPRRVPGAWPV